MAWTSTAARVSACAAGVRRVGGNMRILFLALFGLLAGCAMLPETGTTPFSGNSSGCTWVDSHERQDGSVVAGHYRCPGSQYAPMPASAQCTWVDGYARKDGTYVSGHQRCASRASATSVQPARGRNCHTVRDYYRKNGTYVRGHTRCR